jgi:hypothetical protein
VPKAQVAAYLDQFQKATFLALMDQYGEATFAQVLALKLANLAAARYDFVNRHSVLFSHPVQLTIDPANACQLRARDVFTRNNAYRGVYDWPSTIPLGGHPTRSSGQVPMHSSTLYNWGGHLNKRFAGGARVERYLLYTITSPIYRFHSITKMRSSHPADRMTLSIDGHRETYGRYRRKATSIWSLGIVRARRCEAGGLADALSGGAVPNL